MAATPGRSTEPQRRRFLVLPQTGLGRVALALMGLHAAALGVLIGLSASGQTGGETFTDNLWLATAGLSAGALALAGGLVAAFALLARGERSVVTVATVLYGLVVLTFVLGEVLVPH